MANADRAARVASLVKQILAELIRDKVRDPRIQVQNLVIGDITVTADLSQAKVYMRIIGSENHDMTITILNGMAGFLRTQLGARMQMKKTPKLKFHMDESQDSSIRIEQLLMEVEK